MRSGVDYDMVNNTDLANRQGVVGYEKTFVDDVTPIPEACPDIVPIGGIFSDDFNRPNSTNLGPYTVFNGNSFVLQNIPWLQIFSNQILMSPVSPLKPPNYDANAKTARFNPFPITAKDQYAQMRFNGTTIISTGGPQRDTFGTNFAVCVRMIDNPGGNGFYQAGAGGVGTKAGTLQYEAIYSEVFNPDGTFFRAVLQVRRNEIGGIGGVAIDMAPPFPFPRLSPGDVMRLTAANFLPFGPGFEEVCLKVFINGVLVGRWHDFSSPIPPNQHGRILTGGAGFASEGGAVDPLLQAFFATMLWDDFQAQVANPNPF
jgi:hypothetical protein